MEQKIGTTMLDSDQRQKIIAEVASANGVSAHILSNLLALETEFDNLHAWGARPALRRRMAELIDESMPSGDGGAS